MFAYGCLTAVVSLLAFIWFCFHPLTHGSPTPQAVEMFALAGGATVLHVLALALTWAPYHISFDWLLPRYPPLLHPDRKKVELARAAVVVTTVCSVAAWIALASRGEGSGGAALAGVAWSSTCLAIAVFIAAFWAFQPEYLFSQWMLRAISWDLDYWFSFSEMKAKRAAPAFEPWLAALSECCEKVVASPPGELDCMNLKTELNAQLESRMCLVHHRRLFTHEGFRVIRRFVQAVDALDCRATNALAQQSVADCAKRVLELREGLAKAG